ncbi:MAG: FapA family protein [Candidatus Marinimicrobia bacterium]|nr:FapA family protein [Candidatus Neomarinimicrobiota bacterium]
MNKNSIKIKLSEDQMKAFLSINSQEESFPTKDDIINRLQEQGVSYGIKDEALNELIDKREEVNSHLVAEGQYPEKGKDGKLIWYVESDKEYKPHIDDDGKADYWSNKKISQVEKGDEIVTKLPPTKGSPGKTVTGEEIIIKGKDIALPEGNNVVVSEDGLTLYATCNGHLEYKDGKITISNVYRINGDVDFSTGNIKYNGKIHITGDVRSGFKVESDNTIIIDGNVEAARVYSRNGNIHIGRGIVGKGKANILAGGDLHCGYIQDAKVNISKNIYIEHYAINSDIYAGGHIKVIKNEGLLRGGSIYSEEGIEAIEVGSNNNVPTEIGINFNYPKFNAKIQDLNEKAKTIESELELISKKIKFLNLLKQRIDELSAKKQEEYKTLLHKAKEHKEELKSIRKEKDEYSSITEKDLIKKAIIIRGRLHNNVDINLGNLKFNLEQQYKNIKIYRDSNNISVQKLS